MGVILMEQLVLLCSLKFSLLDYRRVCTATIELFEPYLSTPNAWTWKTKTNLGAQRIDFLQT
jgi:hypothetical protein